MPVHYRIDRARGLSIVEATGRVSGQDILETQSVLIRDPDFDPALPQLCDFRMAEMSMVHSPEIMLIAERSPSPANRGRRAIVVQTGFPFGLARMMEAYANMAGQPTEVFTEVVEALAWLGVSVGTEPS